METDYSSLPAHMRQGAKLYVEHGVEPGGFLRAALENKLIETFVHADDINLAAMQKWASWLYWTCPQIARGSAERVNAWIEHRGRSGLEQARQYEEA